jgi:elongation factor P--(R)-beta-lysine ligase
MHAQISSVLKLRAETLAKIRLFFSQRQVLEVETPILSPATITDPQIQSFKTQYWAHPNDRKTTLYLQTSPEFAMKRLLSAGSGPIYQICKVFRNQEEIGRYHHPEFTLLEWYRPGFTMHQLMDEVSELIQTIFACPPIQRCSYAQIFKEFLNLDPHQASLTQLQKTAQTQDITNTTENKDDWLQLLLTHCIEPKLNQPIFIYDFPITQAALAKIRPDTPPVAERFELYIDGIELANGFHELKDAQEQRQRFLNDLNLRKKRNLEPVPIDERFLQALDNLPDCSGVALGLDRLLLCLCQAHKLETILCFNEFSN